MSYTALLEELWLLEGVLDGPGIQSIAGQRLARRAKTDLVFYFRQLSERVQALGLETFASSVAGEPEVAVQVASSMLEPEIEKMSPTLHVLLSRNLESAFRFGTEEADELIKRFVTEAIGDIPIPPIVGERPGPGDPRAAAFAEETAARLVTGINEETRRRMAALVGRGIRDKLGVPGLGRAIRRKLLQMTRFRSELIALTETNNAVSNASFNRYKQQAIQFKTTGLGPNPCPICIANHAQGPIPIDQPFQSGHQHPTFHPGCLPGWVEVTAPETMVGYRAFYSGELVEILLSDDRRLSITANHMLLSPSGFVAAKFLREGDHIIDGSALQRIVSQNPNKHGRPSPIEQIVGALSKTRGCSTLSVPTAPEYLHGDGRGVDGYIDIVAPDRFLRRAGQTSGSKAAHQLDFNPRNTDLFDFTSSGHLSAMLGRLALSAHRLMGGGGEFLAFRSGKSSHTEKSSLGGSPHRNPHFLQALMDGGAVDLIARCQPRLGLSHQIPTAHIVKINMRKWNGHIYDLQTFSSLYLCNGLVSSNCKDGLLPARAPAV